MSFGAIAQVSAGLRGFSRDCASFRVIGTGFRAVARVFARLQGFSRDTGRARSFGYTV